MPQQVRYVILVNPRRPEPRCEGVPQVVEVEVADLGLLHRPLKADLGGVLDTRACFIDVAKIASS